MRRIYPYHFLIGQVRLLVLVLITGTLMSLGGLAPPAAGAARTSATCRGPEALSNHLALSGKRRISFRRVTCGAARSVVKRFAGGCVAAYTSQGSCTFRSRKRWSCSSRLAGPAASGAPSSVTCKASRSRVRFRLSLSGAIERSDEYDTPPVEAALRYPSTKTCIDSNGASKVVTPPPAAPSESFDIRVVAPVPLVFGQAVQNQLVSHDVANRLHLGLGSQPRNYPRRLPVFLVAGAEEGETNHTCDKTPKTDANVVGIGTGLVEAAETVAHELHHAYTRGIKISPTYPWFEDQVGEWSVWKAGLLKTPTSFEALLQYPNTAADTNNPDDFRYGMWRFVQFLDDRGLMVAGDGSWPIARAVAAGAPAHSVTLDHLLRARGTSFGQELADFWGEHLKSSPSRPPHVKPTSWNSKQIRIAPGRQDVTIPARALHTPLTDFKIERNVKRVEFEFEPPTDGHFWGLYEPNGSKRFKFGDTISFCVGGGDQDDLGWPEHFPVTFTNGLLSGELTGKIQVFAQTQTDQCAVTAGNRACRVLRAAGAEALFGRPALHGYSGHTGTRKGRPYVSCTYGGIAGVATLDIERWRSSKQLRDFIKSEERVPGAERVDLGDRAAMISPDPNALGLHIAVGRQKLALVVATDAGGRSKTLQLGENAVPLVR